MKKDYFLGLSEEGFHKVAFMEWGNAEGHAMPVICVHGLTRNGRDFDALAAYLAERSFHVYCPDIVGRGDSDWLHNPLHYTYEQYAADINALIALTRARQVDWIGTSMGGLIGMFLASLPGSPIRRLIINDVGPQIPVKALSRLASYAGQDPDFTSVDEAKNYFKTIYADFGDDLTDAQWQQLTENSIREIAPGKFITKLDHGIKRSPLKSKFAWGLLLNPHKMLEGTLFDIDLWHVWRNVRCPVLVIHGHRSDLLLPEIIAKMQLSNANMEVLEVPNAGHAPALQNPIQHEVIYQWLLREQHRL